MSGTNRPRVLLIYPLLDADGEKILAAGAEIIRPASDREADIAAVIGEADAVALRGPAKLTASLIAQAPRLRAIATMGSGTDSVDVTAATARGIPVLNQAGGAPRPVAEWALGCMVVMHRKMLVLHERLQNENLDWVSRPTALAGFELTGTTIGVVGLGHIGSHLARMARAAFDAHILAYDPFVDQQKMGDLAEKIGSLEELCERSETLAIHCPLLPSTRGLVRRSHMRLLGPNGVIVHAARGGVVDEADLIAALHAGEIKGAAVDVFDPEPPSIEQARRLAAAPNLLITPHIAGCSDQSARNLATNLARDVLHVLGGGRPRQLVNPEVLKV